MQRLVGEVIDADLDEGTVKLLIENDGVTKSVWLEGLRVVMFSEDDLDEAAHWQHDLLDLINKVNSLKGQEGQLEGLKVMLESIFSEGV